MKKMVALFILLATALSAFAQSSFLELCKTGKPEQIEAALKGRNNPPHFEKAIKLDDVFAHVK